MVIPAEILESPWVILLQGCWFFSLKTQLLQLNQSGHFFFKKLLHVDSMNIPIMLQAASCLFSFFSPFFFPPNTTSLSGGDFISYAVTTYKGKPQEYTKADIFHQTPSVNGFWLYC